MARESWSVLPIELLSLVLNLVEIADLVRLTVVCKNWRQPALECLRRNKNLPWIVSFTHGKLSLCDPWLKKSYSLEKIIRRNGVEKLLSDTNTVHASQHGWLLLSKQEVNSDGSNIVSFLFYNPFRNEIIELPPLDYKLPPSDLNTDKHESRAMCSGTPTSPDCVIFVASKITRGERVIYMLSTCKSKQWTTIRTTNGWGHQWYVEHMIHMDGKFYCIFGQYSDRRPYIKLGIFNVALQEWGIERYDLEFTVCSSRSLIEFEGELFVVDRYRNVRDIWHFDRSEKTLKKTNSLEDRVLFLTHRPFPALSMAAIGAVKEFANMIVLLGLSGYETCTREDDQGHWIHYQTHDWYEGFRPSESTFWIDGPKF